MPKALRYEKPIHWGTVGHWLAFDLYREINGGTRQEAVDLDAADAEIALSVTRINGVSVFSAREAEISSSVACRARYALTEDDFDAMPPGIYQAWWFFEITGEDGVEQHREGPIEFTIMASSATGDSSGGGESVAGGPLFTDPVNLSWGVSIF